MKKHTELPWEEIEPHPGFVFVHPSNRALNTVERGGQCICELMGKDKEANAEFIVRACNSHDELLEALKDVYAILTDAPELNMSNYSHDDVALLNTEMCEAWTILKDAIARAKPV